MRFFLHLSDCVFHGFGIGMGHLLNPAAVVAYALSSAQRLKVLSHVFSGPAISTLCQETVVKSCACGRYIPRVKLHSSQRRRDMGENPLHYTILDNFEKTNGPLFAHCPHRTLLVRRCHSFMVWLLTLETLN